MSPLPCPTSSPAPWQLMQRGHCIPSRVRTIASQCNLLWGESKRLFPASLSLLLENTSGSVDIQKAEVSSLPLHGPAKIGIPWRDDGDSILSVGTSKSPPSTFFFPQSLTGSVPSCSLALSETQ